MFSSVAAQAESMVSASTASYSLWVPTNFTQTICKVGSRIQVQERERRFGAWLHEMLAKHGEAA